MFPLCKTCADTLNQNPCTHTDQERAILGTWCHVELMKAIEKGYQVLEIHEVWHWEETTNELFKDYVNMYLKRKQEASGYPKHCVTDEQKQRYIDEYYEHEGIRLDPNKIEYNSGLRWLAKLMLNSLWGMYIMFLILVKPSLVQLVEHGTVVKNSGHPRVSGSSPERGINSFFFIRKICATVEFNQNRIGDRTQRVVRFVVFLGIRSNRCTIGQRRNGRSALQKRRGV